MRGNFTAGTSVSSAASISLPSGLSIDSTKISSSSFGTNVGFAFTTVSSGNVTIAYGTNTYDLTYDGSTTGSIFFTYQTTSSAQTKTNASSIVGSGGVVNFDFLVPIAGWSSTTQMSNDTDTRVVALSATASTGSIMGTLGSSATAVIYNTVNNDTHSAYNSTTGVYTAPSFR